MAVPTSGVTLAVVRRGRRSTLWRRLVLGASLGAGFTSALACGRSTARGVVDAGSAPSMSSPVAADAIADAATVADVAATVSVPRADAEREPPSAAPDAIPTSRVEAVFDAGAPDARSACTALERSQAAFWQRLGRSVPGGGVAPCAPTPIAGTGRCTMDPRGEGAWALAVRAVEVTWAQSGAGRACDFSARVDVVRFTGGRATTFTPGKRPTNYRESHWTPENTSSVSLKTLMDWDGDGAPEVRVTIGIEEHEGEGEGFDGVLSSGALAIAPYAPAMKLWPRSRRGRPEIRDVDGDGRLDIVFFPYRHVAGSVFGFTIDDGDRSLPFLAHSLSDGTFSTNDAAATDFAKRACPIAPSALVLGDGSREPEAVGRRIACARVWGVSPTDMAAPFRASCPKLAAPTPMVPPGACPEWLDAWRRQSPPVSLTFP